MKTILMAVGLLVSCLASGADSGPSCKFGFDNHRIEVEFVPELKTNKIANYWINAIAIRNGLYYDPPAEKPFPRVTESTESFEVVSNTLALFILDGTTNTVTQSSKVIGRIERKRVQTILAATNEVESETFGPPPSNMATNFTVLATNILLTNLADRYGVRGH